MQQRDVCKRWRYKRRKEGGEAITRTIVALRPEIGFSSSSLCCYQDGCTFSCYPQTVHFLFLSLIQKEPLNFSLLDSPFFCSEIMQSNILASSSKQKSTFGVCHSKKPFMSWRHDNCKRVLLAEKLSVMIFLMAMTETLLVPLTAKSANGTFEYQQQKIHTTELITILPVKNLQTGNTKFQLVAHQHSIPFFSRSLPLHCIRHQIETQLQEEEDEEEEED